MPQFLVQSSFQFGEVSELLHAQVNSEIYYKAARRVRNMLVIPQSGIERRFGLLYRDTIQGIVDYTIVKPFIFDYEDGTRYLLIFRDLAIDVYHEGVFIVSVVTTYTASEISSLSLTQSPNLLFIAHGSHKPAILRRTAAHAGWALETNPNFIHYPTYDFLQNYDTAFFQFKVAGVLLTKTQNLIGHQVDITSTLAGTFTANHVGGLYFGDGATLRIETFTSGTAVTARILHPFSDSSSIFLPATPQRISGADSVLTEVAFSTTRGWPQKVSFFQNRIFFARTSSLLGGIWGSNYNGFKATSFIFDDSDELDTNAISTVLYSTKQAVVIQHLVFFKTLLIMTSSGLFSTSLLQEGPLTPTNVSFINLQTADASNSVEPCVFDNEVIFFDKGGRKVKNIVLNGNSTRYETHNISVLAPQLIDTPCSAGVFENSSIKDGNWLFMINSGGDLEGTVSIFQSVPEQEIAAWTLSTTDGQFRHVVCDEELVYFIVERIIEGDVKLFIEELNFDLLTDATYVNSYGSPTDVIVGLSYLEGKEVRVIGDGAVMQSQTVVSGSITLEREVTEVRVGLNYDPEVIPMPINIPTQYGNNVYLPKSIKSVYVDFYQSAGIKVNGTYIPPFRFNEDQYDEPVILKTDFVNVCPFNGWDPRQEIVISQTDPLPFTLIGVGFEVTL